MKFSDVEQGTWEELRPYVDTCLLPVTGLTGSEPPWEATQALEELRDALDCFEIPYKGRVVTYPAFHFVSGEETSGFLKQVCRKLRENGFRYIIVISAKPVLEPLLAGSEADLHFTLSPELLQQSLPEVKQRISDNLQLLWSKQVNL
ncbi:MAG: hypothetical protein K0S39_5266 [Paenibacillus sp.]|jgi:hypothetical protein|nr:hypothetical protein [Paenibacillus sp.]